MCCGVRPLAASTAAIAACRVRCCCCCCPACLGGDGELPDRLMCSAVKVVSGAVGGGDGLPVHVIWSVPHCHLGDVVMKVRCAGRRVAQLLPRQDWVRGFRGCGGGGRGHADPHLTDPAPRAHHAPCSTPRLGARLCHGPHSCSATAALRPLVFAPVTGPTSSAGESAETFDPSLFRPPCWSLRNERRRDGVYSRAHRDRRGYRRVRLGPLPLRLLRGCLRGPLDLLSGARQIAHLAAADAHGGDEGAARARPGVTAVGIGVATHLARVRRRPRGRRRRPRSPRTSAGMSSRNWQMSGRCKTPTGRRGTTSRARTTAECSARGTRARSAASHRRPVRVDERFT
jgi:hypothetical protein